MLAIFYAAAVLLIGAAGLMAGGQLIFVLGLIAFAAHLGWQVMRLDIDDPAHCLMLFKSNRDAGLILFAAMLLEAAFSKSPRLIVVVIALDVHRQERVRSRPISRISAA